MAGYYSKTISGNSVWAKYILLLNSGNIPFSNFDFSSNSEE